MVALNPFLYGKPVPPAQHVGRRIEIRTLFSRLANGESSAIVGEPHIGKNAVESNSTADKVKIGWKPIAREPDSSGFHLLRRTIASSVV